MHDLCVRCGHNIKADEGIVAGRWRVEIDAVFYDGLRVPNITPSESCVLHSIAAAKGRLIRSVAIGSRCSYAEYPENTVKVHISRMRKKLPSVPFVGVSKSGYRWVGQQDGL